MTKKIRRNNPWAEFAEEFRAEARKYKALRNELGRVFQPLQEEAYESYCAWEVEEDSREETRIGPITKWRMAAATSDADLEETSELIIFEEITLDEATFHFAEQPGIPGEPGGSILLSGPRPPDATHIHFGRDQYLLSPTNSSEWSKIENVYRADVSDYIEDYRQDSSENPIWFSDSNGERM